MTATRPSTLACALLMLGGLAIVLGVLTARPALFIAAIMLLVPLWSTRRPDNDLAVSVELDASPPRVVEGERVMLTVRLVIDAPVPLVDLLVALPANFAVGSDSGCTRWITGLRHEREIRQQIELQAAMSGQARITGVVVRLGDATGIWYRDVELETATAILIYPQAIALKYMPRPRDPRATFGNHVSSQIGEGIEPAELGPFVAGDRARHINWPASLRRQQLYVTRFDAERSADVIVLIDTFALVGTRPRSTLDACARAAAAIATTCIARRDRVGMIELGGYLRWLRPQSGRAQLDRLLASMLPADVVFTYVSHRLDYVPRNVLPPRALVLAVTPLIDARFERAVLDLAHRGYQVAMLAVLPLEFMRETLPDRRLNRTALRLWSLERQAHLRSLRSSKIAIVEWDPDQPLAPTLALHGWPPQGSRRPS